MGRIDAKGKVTAVAGCIQNQFNPNEIDVSFRSHYKQVRRKVQLFRNTGFDASIETVGDNKVRNVIENLKHSVAPGHGGMTNNIMKELLCHSPTT